MYARPNQWEVKQNALILNDVIICRAFKEPSGFHNMWDIMLAELLKQPFEAIRESFKWPLPGDVFGGGSVVDF